MPFQEIFCQQILEEDASVFSIQWTVLPLPLARSISPCMLVTRYLSYIRCCTCSLIRPGMSPEGVHFHLPGGGMSLLTFSPPLMNETPAGTFATMRIRGGVLTQPRRSERGELRFGIEKTDGGVKISLQLSGFCPLILGSPEPSWFRRWLYRLTQAAMHRRVTARFFSLLYREMTGTSPRIRILPAKIRDGWPI